MTRITFKRGTGNVRPLRPSVSYRVDPSDCLFSNLARPEVELKALAQMMNAMEWTNEAFVSDGRLVVMDEYDVPLDLQERALLSALAIARTALVEGMGHMAQPTKPAIEPLKVEAVPLYSRSATTYRRAGGGWVMPEGSYAPGLGVEEVEGLFLCHFVVSTYFCRETQNLAITLLQMTQPAWNVVPANETRDYHEFTVSRRDADLPRLAVHALAVASFLLDRVKKESAKLQWGGAPSAFLDEDNDARDILLQAVVTGSKMLRTPATEDHSGPESRWLYSLDGSTVAAHIAERLMNGGFIQPQDGIFGRSNVLVATDQAINPRGLTPRMAAVPFKAFAEGCSFRRYDGDRECAHDGNCGSSDHCDPDSCPLLRQAYSAEEHPSWSLSRSFDDPAFDDTKYDRNPLMVAAHRNTERSAAWRTAHGNRTHMVINRVLHAKLTGNAATLLDDTDDAAIDEAIRAGWLQDITPQTMRPIGRVLEPTAALLAKVRPAEPAPMDGE